jgi:hypothetical protein
MSRKLISAQKPFKMLVANLTKGSDPSRGPSGNPVKARSTYTVQMFPEIAGRGPEVGTPDPRTPGLGTRMGHVAYTTSPIPVAAAGTITVATNTFTGPTQIHLGPYVLVTGVDFALAAGVPNIQSTGTATVVANPSTATLTIGGQALSDAGGARTPGSNDYDGTLGSPALIAADIVAAINDPLNGFGAIVTAADAGGGAVTLTAVPLGAAGDLISLATSDAGDITVTGAFLTGGQDETGMDGTAANLAAAIDALPGYSAPVPGAAVVTVTGPFGVIGNEVAFYAGGANPQNFTFDPIDGTMDGAEPEIGPPVLG